MTTREEIQSYARGTAARDALARYEGQPTAELSETDKLRYYTVKQYTPAMAIEMQGAPARTRPIPVEEVLRLWALTSDALGRALRDKEAVERELANLRADLAVTRRVLGLSQDGADS